MADWRVFFILVHISKFLLPFFLLFLLFLLLPVVDHCFILADGRIAGQGPPAELRDSDNPSVDQFMNGRVDGPIPFRYAQTGGDRSP